ncbi:N-acetyltransferase [Streptomyces tsukubensis]|uniref:N-acetyltransferase n=1 Tax=Streptomyces tsukubensis TaxID=83656 RepID=UPI0036C68A67
MSTVTDISAHPVAVSPVSGRRGKTEFIRLPYHLYRGDPYWIPPLEYERRQFLSSRHNPFFRYGEVGLFLARRGPRIVGRIAAVRNSRYEEFQGKRHGFFGLFECENDPEAARALFDEASKWLLRFGLESMLGPVSFSLNDECGTLVSGFDHRPMVMMSYNPPYHDRLMNSCGFSKAKDLWAWKFSVEEPPTFLLEQAEQARARSGVTVRTLELQNMKTELPRMIDVYNSAWKDNWGFVPMTGEEVERHADRLRRVIEPELVLTAEVDGVPAAFLLALPDANEAVAAAQGRLTRWGVPIGLLRMLRAAGRIEGMRMAAFGVAPGYRRLGLDALLYTEAWQAARRLGYRRAELSWTLEDNAVINRVTSAMGGERYKTYRIYQRPLGSVPPAPAGRW